ncbi:glycine betaine/L-proline ABC transporter substrate-binding protein ProX [Bisbaumannia pacifica]|uniref:Glycine betaine/L-proline ABC transporter substrate-binding protein ProX n=1 Tax=Bisbaumannia pacifica TaxID=77098 RepID=A0ABD4KXA2_9GAMM|nr:glycine betaine/L-proline ABC transporter substrate-binding protein ProX [Halomonas pacifica]MBH8578999.1 glycine betaine/L-proline ABC transporter substrate-binding protein ProX [Halomonas pacifica]
MTLIRRKPLLAALALATAALTPLPVLAEARPGEGVSVTPIFPSVAEEHFRGQIAIMGLEELGYTVEAPRETEYAGILLGLAYGEGDFTVHAWDKLHDDFYQQVGGDEALVKAGEIIPGVLQGYLIDRATAEAHGISSLEDLRDPEIAALFDVDGDGRADLTGCNPGWGCEQVIDYHLLSYGLADTVTHHRGPYFSRMADIIARHEQGEPILYYTWVPQWISGVLVPGEDVVWLEVPHTSLPDGNNDVNTHFNGQNLGFAVDAIQALLNRDFAEQNPAAREFLAQVQLTTEDESAQNLRMQEGEASPEDIRRHAAEWIEAHRDQFDAWLAEARAAAD